MGEAEIRKSLEEQMMEEDEREIIFNQVCFKELVYLKKMAQKRVGKILLIIGVLVILAATALFLYIHYQGGFEYSFYVLYSLYSVGFVGVLGGLLLRRA